MARKQKRSAPSGSSGGATKWNTRDDIEETEQDVFHRQQDRIALGDLEDSSGAADKDDEYGSLSFGRGILDVNEEEVESDSDEEEDAEEDDMDEPEDAIEAKSGKKKAVTSVGKSALKEMTDDNDEESAENQDGNTNNLPMGNWGSNKQSYYNTNNLDELSSDSEMEEDERRELEVQEVKRIQARARQGMTDEDFGLTQDNLRLEGSSQAQEARRKEFEDLSENTSDVTSSRIDMKSITPLQRAEMIQKIQKTTPETLALIGEYADIIEDITTVSNRLRKVMGAGGQPELAGLCCLHHQLLLTYAANLSFYFYLRASPKYAGNPTLLAEHAVISRLWKLKNGLSLLDQFGFSADDSEVSELGEDEDEIESIENDEDEENIDPSTSFLYRPSPLTEGDDEDDEMSLGSLEEDELMQLYTEEKDSEDLRKQRMATREEDATTVSSSGKKDKVKKKKKKKDVAPLAMAIQEAEEEENDSFAGMKERKKTNTKRVLATSDAEAYNSFGEPTQLSTSDSADKEAKKRSLKFYTGQIDAKEARKAGGSGLGGDTDIPYRDRDRSRMAVANANAKRAGASNGLDNSTLNGDEWGEEDSRDWGDVMGAKGGEKALQKEGLDEEDDYYDLVASGKKSAKRAKKDEYDSMRASQRVAPVEDLDDGEHRGINRTIEKNRGLTPHRKKENRNPRVKKRKRYEAAQKKLSSRGPVYKGGQGALQGGYSGEKSGINSNVVKSRSFA